MRTRTKILGLVMAAVLLVGVTVFGTMAYLTSQDSVTNTFSVGSVSLTLDEAKVDDDEQALATTVDRVKANSYKLLPGKSYAKDPTVHVTEGSEAAWLFVKVENGIAAIEDGPNTIAAQITTNGWQSLTGVDNVYYRLYDGGTTLDYKVFESFKIKGDVSNTALAGYATTVTEAGTSGAQILVTAYAVQKEGFDTAAAAWAATFGAEA